MSSRKMTICAYASTIDIQTLIGGFFHFQLGCVKDPCDEYYTGELDIWTE